MRFTVNLRILNCTIWYLFLFSVTINGQSYNFRNHGAESGIPSSFIYTIDQSNDGYLWTGTGNGIARFDGFEFYKVAYPDSITGRYPTVSLKDKSGKLWFGCSDGTVFYARNRELVQVHISNTQRISDIIEEIGRASCRERV